MKEYSQIRVTITTNEVGIWESKYYEWVGKSPYIIISYRFIFDLVGAGGMMNKIQIGAYKLRMVERMEYTDSVLYVRDDILGAVRVFIYNSTRWLDRIYRRMIITLAVWGLAEYHASTVPAWRDIKIFKRWGIMRLKNKS